jgi:uncharacterized UBP type Zn finger protein
MVHILNILLTLAASTTIVLANSPFPDLTAELWICADAQYIHYSRRSVPRDGGCHLVEYVRETMNDAIRAVQCFDS